MQRSSLSVRGLVLGTVAVLAASAAISGARAANHDFSVVALPEAYRHSGPFGPAELLDANGDKRLDVVSKFGSMPVIIFAPSMSQTTLPISACQAVDIAVWPGAEADDVLASTASGLVRYRYVETLMGGRPGYVETQLLGAVFASSTALAVVDLDGDGDLDVAALADGGRNILRAHSGPSGALTLAAPITLSGQANDLVVVRWGAGLAYAITRGETLRLIDELGATLDAFAFSGPIVDTVRIREGAATSPALAVLTNVTGGVSRINVVRAGGFIETALELGTIEAFALYSADIDGSGFDDLVITGRADGFLRVALHGGAAAPASYCSSAVSAVEVLDESFDPSEQGANALAADFDRDGDVDLFHLAEATRAGIFARETVVAHVDYAPELIGAYIEFRGPAPHAVIDVRPRRLRSGALPTQVGVELWSELPGGPTLFGGHPLSFPIGRTFVDIDSLDPEFAVRIDSSRQLGDRAWVLLRGFEAGGTALEVGTDDVFEFHRIATSEGGGAGSTTGGQNGDATTPPPKHIPPIGVE